MQEVFGNTLGLSPSDLQSLRRTYRRRVDANVIVSTELARHLTGVSQQIHRQVGIFIDRKGNVEAVMVGDAKQIELPDIGRARAGSHRLRGLRLVHTHLNGEPLTRDDHTDLCLLRLDLVAAIEVRTDGEPGKVNYAHILPENPRGDLWRDEQADSVHDLNYDPLYRSLAIEEELARSSAARRVTGSGRAILVGFGVGSGARDRAAAQASLEELGELARTAGVEVLDSLLQLRREIDPRYLVGRGKIDELALRSMQLMADYLIFDANLAPSQARHIAERCSLKILDRTQLILDIFAQRAQSNEGKLQVELAQLKYLYPRLTGSDESLSRLAGGIGGRGPGETKLEIDRRRVRDRITQLERRIDDLSRGRATRRKRRIGNDLPVLSIVGYTNAGKSTLLNALTHSTVLTEDKLFATLDPTSRRLRFPTEREVIITDTVGFIRDLPKDLMAAFRSTLEELNDADLLLHVVDASDPRASEQVKAVEKVLAQLGLENKPRLLVWNKVDRMTNETGIEIEDRESVRVSAKEQSGLSELLQRCDQLLWALPTNKLANSEN